MKRVLLMVFSIILILACIFGLFACVAGVRDVLNISDYKSADAAYARENIETALAGIAQLKENEETYLTGVGTYTDGLSQYSKGKSDYAAAQATLAAGEKTLAEAYAAYEAGKKTLAEGQAKIDANTQAYNEGKEKLAKIEPLLPYLNQYVQFRDGTIANLPGFTNAQAWFVSVVRPLAARLGLEIPADVTDFPAYINQMVADGKAQLKAYEDGLAELAAGKKQLAEAEKQLAAGEAKLAAGRQDLAAGANKLAVAKGQLADGKAQLSVFEQGELTLVEGARAFFEGEQPCFSFYGGEQTVKSLPEYLAIEFGLEIPDNLIVKEDGRAHVNEEAYEEFGEYVISNMYKVDENGAVVEKNGYPMLDLDKFEILCDKAEQYLQDQEADIKSEGYVRLGMYVALAVAAVLGIIAGIFGIVAAVNGSKRTGKTLSLISAIMAVAVLVTGLVTKFHDYVYTIRVDSAGNYVSETAAKLDFVPVQEYTGSLHLTAICVLAGAAILGVIFAFIASKAAKDKEAALAAAAAEDNDEDVGYTPEAYAAAYAAAEAAIAAAAAEKAAAASAQAADETVIEAEQPAPEASDEETVKE